MEFEERAVASLNRLADDLGVLPASRPAASSPCSWVKVVYPRMSANRNVRTWVPSLANSTVVRSLSLTMRDDGTVGRRMPGDETAGSKSPRSAREAIEHVAGHARDVRVAEAARPVGDPRVEDRTAPGFVNTPMQAWLFVTRCTRSRQPGLEDRRRGVLELAGLVRVPARLLMLAPEARRGGGEDLEPVGAPSAPVGTGSPSGPVASSTPSTS